MVGISFGMALASDQTLTACVVADSFCFQGELVGLDRRIAPPPGPLVKLQSIELEPAKQQPSKLANLHLGRSPNSAIARRSNLSGSGEGAKEGILWVTR